jgi:hypothetical protein
MGTLDRVHVCKPRELLLHSFEDVLQDRTELGIRCSDKTLGSHKNSRLTAHYVQLQDSCLTLEVSLWKE